MKIHWDLLQLLSWKENADVLQQITANLLTSNAKTDLHNINALTKFHENPLISIELSSRNEIINMSQADNSNIEEICPLATPRQISTISVHIPSFVKNHWYLLKLSSGTKSMDMSWADNSVENTWNLSTSNYKPDLFNTNAHAKFGENSFVFTQIIVRKWKYG